MGYLFSFGAHILDGAAYLPLPLVPTTSLFCFGHLCRFLGIWEKALTNKTVGLKGRLVQRNGYINLVPLPTHTYT
ncbi:hypothetical protein CPAR01_13147 [Colletotrichum paranaense]|uniref:Uncharacterized protein n=2 Tax=Colletotrichum acutatum species complex TaxID=2707335 RepID=A0AAI9U1N3_9PEZI|nr:uncharacterized protein CPAR01_13147 [Colletotrichum paranaense]KAK1448718.1 hypothetical protein CMEL01_08033 [Colletotrichum melonis]KAK1526619.1 hypothetical protein CPAR01_13147 [Colletotrichum paranaense]